MKYVIPTILFLASVASWSSVTTPSSAESEAIAASKARMGAFNRRDEAALARSTAKDFLVSDGGAVVHGRQKLLTDALNTGAEYEQWENLRNYEAQKIGNVIVVTFVYDEREQIGDVSIISVKAATELWVGRTNKLILAAKSITNIAVNHRPAIKLDSQKLQEYVGRYEWRPGLIDEVSVRNGRLVSNMEGTTSETYFAAPDVNLIADRLEEAIYQRDSTGKVIGYVYRRPDGQTNLARKLQ